MTATADTVRSLPTAIAAYFAEHASSDPTAPMVGAPFTQNGRLYLQLEGRGGAGRDAEDFVATGLRPYLVATNGDAPPKAEIQKALIELGFTRKPFSYNHPDRGSSSASYYSRDANGFGAVAPTAERVRPRAAARTYEINVVTDVLLEPIVPQMPEGSPEDVAALNDLRAKYEAARQDVRNLTARLGGPIKTTGVPPAVLAAQRAEREARRDELKGIMREAQADLLTQRRVMFAKLQAARENA